MFLSIASVLILVIASSKAFELHSSARALRIARFSNVLNSTPSDPRLDEFLSGSGRTEWKGTTTILKRKGQVPLETHTPADIIRICLDALKLNDEPQLDHGCCVVMEFRSPTGPLSQLKNPAEFGNFLRSDESYSSLVDFHVSNMVGALDVVNTNSAKQTVEIIGWGQQPKKTKFDFYLSKHASNWLLDVILKNSS